MYHAGLLSTHRARPFGTPVRTTHRRRLVDVALLMDLAADLVFKDRLGRRYRARLLRFRSHLLQLSRVVMTGALAQPALVGEIRRGEILFILF